MKLKLGRFYVSRDGKVWCCFRKTNTANPNAQFYCIRTSDNRVEYFYADGRYDQEGKREHSLVGEVDYPGTASA